MPLLDAVEVVGVTNTVHSFFHCLDSGDAEGLADLFVAGKGFHLTTMGKRTEGREQLKGFVAMIRERFPQAQHWEGNLVITAHSTDADKACSRSYWKAQHGDKVVSYGTHVDELQKVEGKWLFTHRDISHTWTAGGGFSEKSAL